MIVLYLILISVAGFFLLRWVSSANPASVARMIRIILPVVLAIIGLALTFMGRVGIGGLLLAGSLSLIMREWAGQGPVKRPQKRSSVVRSAALEMELDHDTGDLEGVVLAGEQEGRALSTMQKDELLSLHRALIDDRESLELLEAYLDRRFAHWRDSPDADANKGQRRATASGSMTEEEAYQILGLERGAAAAEIRQAHRRLMQRVHPDKGGSSFLAARINEAKDVLLARHS
ncbi:MAG: DnaJ domain-containing protein [Phyllobacterium sp.]